MGRFDTTKATINANIKKNGNQEITGSILNSVMTEMVDATDAQLAELSIARTLSEDVNKAIKELYLLGADKSKDYKILRVDQNSGVWRFYIAESVTDNPVALATTPIGNEANIIVFSQLSNSNLIGYAVVDFHELKATSYSFSGTEHGNLSSTIFEVEANPTIYSLLNCLTLSSVVNDYGENLNKVPSQAFLTKELKHSLSKRFPIEKADEDILANCIIDAYMPQYNNAYKYYIDLFFWKHPTYGTRIRLMKENIANGEVSEEVYDSNVQTDSAVVQKVIVQSRNGIVMYLAINTAALNEGYNFSDKRIEFSRNISVDNYGLWLTSQRNDSKIAEIQQEINGLKETINIPQNQDKDLLLESVNLLDGEYENGFYLSTTGEFYANAGFRSCKNPIPVAIGQRLISTYNNEGTRQGTSVYIQEYSDINGTQPIVRNSNLIQTIYQVSDAEVKSIRVSWRTEQLGGDETTLQFMIYDLNSIRVKMRQPNDTYEDRLPYQPTGYYDIISPYKNALLNGKKGKKYVAFGDSITEQGFYPELACELIGMECVLNAGFGGCRWGEHPTDGYTSFSMYKLVDAILKNDWSEQLASAESLSSLHPKWKGKIEKLQSIDFNTIDIVTIAYGTNDFMGGTEIGTSDDGLGGINDVTRATLTGSVNYTIKELLTKYPHLQIVIILPIYRVFVDASPIQDSNTYQNFRGLTLLDIREKIKDAALAANINILDIYHSMGCNLYNYSYYLDSGGTHPTYDGYRKMGHMVAGHILNL